MTISYSAAFAEATPKVFASRRLGEAVIGEALRSRARYGWRREMKRSELSIASLFLPRMRNYDSVIVTDFNSSPAWIALTHFLP